MCNELYCFVSKTEQIPIFTTTLNFNIAFLDIFLLFPEYKDIKCWYTQKFV